MSVLIILNLIAKNERIEWGGRIVWKTGIYLRQRELIMENGYKAIYTVFGKRDIFCGADNTVPFIVFYKNF